MGWWSGRGGGGGGGGLIDRYPPVPEPSGYAVISLVSETPTGTLSICASCATHMFPSGPSVAARPNVGDGSWTTSELEIAPPVAIRPMEDPPTWLPLSTNQIFPSAPVVIP